MKSEKVKESKEEPPIFLCDNGSLFPSAIEALASVASGLGGRMNRKVLPVGLLHSDAAPVLQRDGASGRVLLAELRKLLEAGERKFCILPFFLGPSRGVTDWLPKKFDQLRKEFPEIQVETAGCLAGAGDEILYKGLTSIMQ